MSRLVTSHDLFQRLLLKCLQLFYLFWLLLYSPGSILNAQETERELTNTTDLVERLYETNLINGDEIYAQLKLVGTNSPKFSTANPYKPRYTQSFERFPDIASSLPQNTRSYELNLSKRRLTFFGQEPVFDWYRSLPTNTDVCGVRFLDARRQDYELTTFSSEREATANDYVISHRYHCGTCSSLQNLAVYLGKPDLTTPARSCARKLTLRGIKECLVQTIGFKTQCAETWAYNVAHTKQQCMATCIKHYGLWRVIRNEMGDAHVDGSRRLNPCLACDELVSGPGFQYVAGRTRRASGLKSAIERSPDEVYAIDHSLYFK